MKQALFMLFCASVLAACVFVPPGHDPNGPGNSENAPGHNKHDHHDNGHGKKDKHN